MARNGVFSRRRKSDKIDVFDHFPTSDSDVHVLAVDDSLIDRTVIERLLKLTACKVTAVDSGLRALQYLGLQDESDSTVGLKVDMIITDYCMPGMTGYELLKKIKESSTLRKIPVVIMSSENVVARIDRCLEEGAEDFIVKPVKLSDVKRLREFMMGDDKPGSENQRSGINKRKLRDLCDVAASSPSISLSSTSPSPSLSTSHSLPSTPSSSESDEPSSPTSTLQSDGSK